MASVIIFTKKADPYSVRAKAFLDAKRVNYIEKVLPEFASELRSLCGTEQTPQIFINDVHIGSFDALGSLELRGELDRLLSHSGKAHVDFRSDQPRR